MLLLIGRFVSALTLSTMTLAVITIDDVELSV
jgi:hypothetical protein